ncbi:hypothetical protein A3J19_04585 [Candidatus Daviesbacteria bacterium RIFCSPLOWO2_02_FULL_41_8]|uniref:O-antigen polymerase n=3 Tax=Candidatus Daviesiibacteriota TaxID=1752718 RepID=A0A1F5NJG8_9BACT|nr:MAG: hypothetical protein A2871_03155 [Candidatus Daviesbacteria bacterium RIFCSPHIGHO2_01_FULL_41_23]OGE32408.1 MAG: hypothetical protein A3D83_02000 [Candidatus Daviesbacteria bacterium RIFCSPHIGHO2_02_FULL_41_10]OGE61927.1 MAG: hypothetical protein A2967_02970 [Candidatus Daviesbacteria bacterium RIFCSPLOWO2_01_FULL_41_32]OGE77703.1 MAG: hypothetical protein A3J19_04585 [Candidatus Daviesbacteria bacterium RIFCSPLOWO2_02_FULL_41_8]
MAAVSFLTTFLLFYLPLLVVPVGYSYFEIPKVFVAEGLIILISVFFLLKGNLRPLLENKKLLYPVLGIFTLSIIDLIFFRTATTFFGNSFRLQGIFLLWNLLLFALVSSALNIKRISPVFFLLPLVGLLISIFLVGVDGRGQYVGTLGEASALAATVAFIWPFAFLKLKQKSLKWASLLLAAIIIFLSGQRAGFVAFGIQVAILVISVSLKQNLKMTVIFGLAVAVLSLTGPFFDPPGWYENRAEIWKTALTAPFDQIHDNKFSVVALLIGRGFGNVEQVLPKLSTGLDNNVRFQYVDSAHNVFLDWWIEGGILGVGLLSWLVFPALKRFTKKNDKVLILSFMGVLVLLLFNPLSVVNLVQFWWLIGQGFSKDLS